MESISLSIVIPVFNAQHSIKALYHRLLEATEFAETLEIIMVDDYSSDASRELIEEISRTDGRVRYAFLGKNCGQQEASLLGISLARHEYIATIDCDLQNPPELLEDMLGELIRSEAEIVYASPKRESSGFGSRVRDLVFSLCFALPKGLHLSSYRVFSRALAEYVLAQRKSFIYFSAIVFSRETPAAMIYYDYTPRARGKSGYNFIKKARLIFGIILYYGPLTRLFFRKRAGLTVKDHMKKANF